MSTRRLILTALVCGLAILLAGGIQLFRIADDDPVELPGLGDARTVSGVEVTVVNVGETGDATLVEVSVRATSPDVTGNAGEGWTLVRGNPFSPIDVPADAGAVACSTVELTADAQDCVVAFAAPGNDARFLGYQRGSVEARWALDD